MLVRGVLAVLTAGIVSVFAVLLIRGEYIQEGPTVWIISNQRGWGVHRGDILIAGGWLIAMIALLGLTFDGRPRRREEP